MIGIVIYNIRSGGHLHHEVFVLGVAIHYTHLYLTPRLGTGKTQVAATLVQDKLGTGGPKACMPVELLLAC